MAKPWIHAESSAKRFGGKPEEYLKIHELMDTSKGTLADSRHRCLTHTSWFIMEILPRIFGDVFTNSDGKVISIRDIGEQHILEDYSNRFIPTVQDFLEDMPYKAWMNNGHGEAPPSFKKVIEERKEKTKVVFLT